MRKEGRTTEHTEHTEGVSGVTALLAKTRSVCSVFSVVTLSVVLATTTVKAEDTAAVSSTAAPGKAAAEGPAPNAFASFAEKAWPSIVKVYGAGGFIAGVILIQIFKDPELVAKHRALARNMEHGLVYRERY